MIIHTKTGGSVECATLVSQVIVVHAIAANTLLNAVVSIASSPHLLRPWILNDDIIIAVLVKAVVTGLPVHMQLGD